jgi:uncharacterized lipoprotein
MSLSSAPARAKGLSLFLLVAALAACGSHKPPMTEVQRDDAERQALIQAMKRHPALAEGGNNAATGKPIDVPTTVPSKAPGADDRHDHPEPNPKP